MSKDVQKKGIVNNLLVLSSICSIKRLLCLTVVMFNPILDAKIFDYFLLIELQKIKRQFWKALIEFRLCGISGSLKYIMSNIFQTHDY